MESFWNLPNALRKPKMKIMDHNMSVEIISAAKEATAELELDLTYNIIINPYMTRGLALGQKNTRSRYNFGKLFYTRFLHFFLQILILRRKSFRSLYICIHKIFSFFNRKVSSKLEHFAVGKTIFCLRIDFKAGKAN